MAPENSFTHLRRDRESLAHYLASSRAAGDHRSVVDFSFNGYRSEDQTGHLSVRLERGEGVSLVKGAIDCDSGKLMVWSVGPIEIES